MIYNIKDESTKGLEVRELLWTNPSPTAGFNAQDITIGVNDYDEFEVVLTGYTGQPTQRIRCRFSKVDEIGVAVHITGSTGQTQGSFFAFKRGMWATETTIGFGAVFSNANAGTWSQYAAGTGCVPYKIYGIKTL